MIHNDLKKRSSGIVTGLILLSACVSFVSINGCDVDEGVAYNQVPLPTDSTLNLFCEDVGIYPEDCVIDDPENPYATIDLNGELEDNDPNVPNKIRKFVLSSEAPSAKARFYIWATALAQSPQGENQFYTALSLHEMYTESGSVNTQELAKRAYRSVLDNFYGSVTFYEVTFLPGDLFYPVQLNNLVGLNIYDPASVNLAQLYPGDPVLALDALGGWGYSYDTDLGLIFLNQ